jgi:hypothetical protein
MFTIEELQQIFDIVASRPYNEVWRLIPRIQEIAAPLIAAQQQSAVPDINAGGVVQP